MTDTPEPEFPDDVARNAAGLAGQDGMTRRRTLAAFTAGVIPFLSDQATARPRPSVDAEMTVSVLSSEPSELSSGTRFHDAALWFWTLGDFTQRVDDRTVVKAKATPLNVGAWVKQNTQSITASDAMGGAHAPAIHSHQLVTRLTRYGFKGDGSALDTQAWRNAIVEAAERNVNEIIVPRGRSMVDGDLLADVEGRLPAGLTFRGEGRNQDSEDINQTSLVYTGSGVCWDIKYSTGGPAATGRWAWRKLSFRTTDSAGTMFSFNDPLSIRPTDHDPYQYLMRIAFEQCFAYGANGIQANFTKQTGDFLRASKVFHLTIDALTSILGWRRGVWLRGCDNCQINARFVSNVRAVMNEMADGFFANENRIEPYAIAGLPNDLGSSEPSYAIWDDGRDTRIGGAVLFEGRGSVAHMYLNGHRTKIEKPVFGVQGRLFHLGPQASSISMFSPDAPVPNLDWAPVIEPPASPAFGATQTDHRMRIYDAPLNTQLILLAAKDRHGRVQVVSSAVHGLGYPNPDEPGIPTKKGYLVPVACTAGNFWGDNGIGGKPIAGIVPDPEATGGQAIKIGTETGSGFGLHFKIGMRIMPARYTVSIRNRLSGLVMQGTFLFVATRNGTFYKILSANTTTAYDRPTPHLLDLSGFSPGDLLALQFYNNGTGLNAWVDYIVLEPVPD